MTPLRTLAAALVVAATLWMTPTIVSACGMSTHIEVARRAGYWFDHPDYPEYADVVQNRPRWIQPGAFFPDWGYASGWGAEAEAAHWPVYLNYSAMTFRRSYAKPYDEEAKDVSAFLLGAVAHSVADISWHALGVAEGTIEAMAKMEFFDVFGDAHKIADTGGEFIFRHSAENDYIEPRWYVPADLLVDTYRVMDYDEVDADTIELWMKLGFAGAWGNRIFGELLFPFFADTSPFLVEFYENYFMGGLNDMASWTFWCWQEFIVWLEEGGTRPWCKIEEVHWGRYKRNVREEYQKGPLSDELALVFLDSIGLEVVSGPHPHYKGSVMIDLIVKDTGELFNPEADLEAIVARYSSHEKKQAIEERSLAVCSNVSDSVFSDFDTDAQFSNLGSAIVKGDFDNDGFDDIVVGSPNYGGPGKPQEGAVYVLNGQQRPTEVRRDIDNAADMKLISYSTHSRFGFSLATVDLNCDGYDDLAVSSPLTNSDLLFYDGRIDVFLGGPTGLSSSSNITIKVDQPHPELPEDPNDAYEHRYTLLGYTLESADVDGDGFMDLLVGSPFAAPYGEGRQVGMAHVFLSSSNHNGVRDIHDDADIELLGEHDYQWFGFSIAATTIDDRVIMLVGAPTHAPDDDEAQAVGRVYGYVIDGRRPDAELLFTITGEAEFQRFGCSFLFADFYQTGETLVAISSPSEKVGLNWQAGAVRVMDVSELSGDVAVSEVTTHATFQGSHSAAHLGLGGFALSREHFWTSEPFYGSLLTRDGLERGQLYSFRLGSTFPRGVVPAMADGSDGCVRGDEPKDRFGARMVAVDVDGDGSEELVVSSVHSYSGGRLSGLLSILSPPTNTN